MKRISLLLIVVFFVSGGLKAQNLIAVQNGGNPAFYLALDSAIIHAQNGDTIYLSGGPFQISVPLAKRLILVGAGCDQDSSSATSRTYLVGDITFGSGSNYSILTGVEVTGSVYSAQFVENVEIRRCHINGLRLYSSCNGWIFSGNIMDGFIGSYDDPGAGNCLFTNNLIQGQMGALYTYIPGFTNCVFRNNLFFANANGFSYNSSYSPLVAQSSVIENNIFTGILIYAIPNLLKVGLSTLRNNIFIHDWSCPAGCLCTNNISPNDLNDLFIEGSYHLQSSSPGINGGTDGTDIGIYGGLFPWKEGQIPFNPHIQKKTISGTTDPNGNLNVNIKVAAQDR
jgi:hypothetical protein